MNLDYLDFEQPIAELEEKILALKKSNNIEAINLDKELASLQEKSEHITAKIFSQLDDWQIAQVARHTLRPQTQDYINSMLTDFSLLKGDRMHGDDRSIIAGLARFNGTPIVIIGQQKGRTTKDKIIHNFGMAHPEGYRKSLRLIRLAEKFSLPILTLIDTPGAYPGIEAEERGQSEAIAQNLYHLSKVRTVVIAVIIGEGGSGGALALAVADKVLMMQYAIYSIISPEGCASILYKDAKKAKEASKLLQLISTKLLQHQLIDEIVDEPLGGAHRNYQLASNILKESIKSQLDKLTVQNIDDVVKQRQEKILKFGHFNT